MISSDGVALARCRRGRPRCAPRARPAARVSSRARRRRLPASAARPSCAVGPGVVQRQVQRERAALAVDAGQPDLAAEQHGQLAADRQAQAGAAVLARGAGVGLLEGLEDQPLLLRRDADAGVLDREGDHLLRLAEHRMVGAPALVARPTRTSTWPCAVNLTALDSRFFRICCRRFGSLSIDARQVVGELDVEGQVLGLGHVAEVAVDGVAQAGEGDLLDLDRDRAGLDLRQVEDVVDQVQQVGAGGVDVARELDLLGASGCRRRSRRAAGSGSGSS